MITTGILRGAGDTRTAMAFNVVAHWALGLPVAAALAFGAGWGVIGLWIGLCLGLTTLGVALLLVWIAKVRSLLTPAESVQG